MLFYWSLLSLQKKSFIVFLTGLNHKVLYHCWLLLPQERVTWHLQVWSESYVRLGFWLILFLFPSLRAMVMPSPDGMCTFPYIGNSWIHNCRFRTSPQKTRNFLNSFFFNWNFRPSPRNLWKWIFLQGTLKTNWVLSFRVLTEIRIFKWFVLPVVIICSISRTWSFKWKKYFKIILTCGCQIMMYIMFWDNAALVTEECSTDRVINLSIHQSI